VVLKRGIGIGSAIAKLLSEYETKIYSTVRKENALMNHILKKIGFVKTGISYNSKRGDYKINLYTLNK
jgi:RimJ/RimL family protein N-acetyltransferase